MRSCYVSEWALFRGSGTATRGRYVFAPEGTPHYPGFHHYGSRNWTANTDDTWGGLGELPHAVQSYSSGEWQGNFPPAGLIGTADCIENGERLPLPVVARDVEGGFDSRCWALPRPAPPQTPVAINVRWCPTQYRFAVVCELMYAGDGLAAEQELQRLYPTATITRVPNSSDSVPGSLIAIIGTTTIVIVSGTTTPQQWALHGMFTAAGLIDFGQYSTLAIWQIAAEVIRGRIEAAGASTTGNIVFVGHSYGGALASILAFRFKHNTLGRDVQLLTFGSPKPGDERLCAQLDQLPSVHLVNEGDPIPFCPPSGPELAVAVPVIPAVMLGRWQAWARPSNRIGQRADATRYDAPDWETFFDLVYTLVLLAVAGDTPTAIIAHNSGTYVNRIRCPASPSPTPPASGLWWSAEGLAGYTVGNPVPFWMDVSGHGNNGANANPFSQGTAVLGLNGWIGLRLNQFRSLGLASVLQLGSRHTVFIVAQFFGAGTQRCGFSLNGVGPPNVNVGQHTAVALHYFDDTNFEVWPDNVVNAEAHVYTIRRHDADLELWIDLEDQGPRVVNPNGVAWFTSLNATPQLIPRTGTVVVHELRIFDSALSDEEAVFNVAELLGKFALLP